MKNTWKESVFMDNRSKIIDNITISMQDQLTDDQLRTLRNELYMQLNEYEVQERCTAVALLDSSPDAILQRYIAVKKIEGTSALTRKRYSEQCYIMIHTINKPLAEITTYDLRFYLAMYQERNGVQNSTLNGMRKCIRPFFAWLFAENLIPSNPAAALSQIKYEKKVRLPYSAADVEKIRRVCSNIRDLAIVEFFRATGCRVSEMVHLNRSDVNFTTMQAIVHGKGNKQRVVYIDEVTAMDLSSYLASRTDSSEALFVSLRGKDGKRISKEGIEALLKRLGRAAGVDNVHPHRYRRTLATSMIRHGAPIQDVATVLGHENVSTTQVYCHIAQADVQISYNRYS